MHPVLYEFSLNGSDITLRSYTVFMVLAAVLAVCLGAQIARRRGVDRGRSVVSLSMGLIATAIAARLVHWLTNPSSFDSLRDVFSLDRTNLSAFAGLVVGIPVTAIVARRMRIDTWRLADSAAPALGLAIAVARVGCFLNGCCFGTATQLPWGVSVKSGSDAHLAQIASGSIGVFGAPLRVHPTQLYEVAASLIGCALAIVLLKRSRVDGLAFLGFAICYTALRWSYASLLYVPPSYAAPQWLYPSLYALVIFVCSLTVALRIKRSGKRKDAKSGSAAVHSGNA